MYLEDYAHAISFIAAKALDVDALRVLGRFLQQIVENEIPANHRFLARLGGEARLNSLSAMTPVNYAIPATCSTRRLGVPRRLRLAAILPCQWSYGEIASGLAPSTCTDDEIYAG